MLSPIQPADFTVVRKQFATRTRAFSEYNQVFQHVSEKLMDRLELLAVVPNRILDVGCRNGFQLAVLENRFGSATVTGIDPYPTVPASAKGTRWWRKGIKAPAMAAADPHTLPFADDTFDLIVSNLLLPWCYDPARVFAEVARVLRVDGAFLFTTAGPDTLIEYAQEWSKIDRHQHVFGLEDMHQTGDALLHAGFAAPVLDRENITIDYPSIDALQNEMQHLGAGNIAVGRRAGLMSAGVRKKLRDNVHPGRFEVTLELVHGHAWKGELSKQRKNTNDEVSVSLDSLRRSLRSGQ